MMYDTRDIYSKIEEIKKKSGKIHNVYINYVSYSSNFEIFDFKKFGDDKNYLVIFFENGSRIILSVNSIINIIIEGCNLIIKMEEAE